MQDQNQTCSVVSASKLERDMGISKSYRQAMTKKGIFKARQIEGSRKVFYDTCQVREAIFGSKEKPKQNLKRTLKEIVSSSTTSSDSKKAS